MRAEQPNTGNLGAISGQKSGALPCTSARLGLLVLVETCRLNGINPEAYLTDVIGRIGRTKIRALDTLLPFNWRPPDAGNPADPGRMTIAPHGAVAA